MKPGNRWQDIILRKLEPYGFRFLQVATHKRDDQHRRVKIIIAQFPTLPEYIDTISIDRDGGLLVLIRNALVDAGYEVRDVCFHDRTTYTREPLSVIAIVKTPEVSKPP